MLFRSLHSGYHPGHQSARPHPCPLTHTHTHRHRHTHTHPPRSQPSVACLPAGGPRRQQRCPNSWSPAAPAPPRVDDRGLGGGGPDASHRPGLPARGPRAPPLSASRKPDDLPVSVWGSLGKPQAIPGAAPRPSPTRSPSAILARDSAWSPGGSHTHTHTHTHTQRHRHRHTHPPRHRDRSGARNHR